MGQTMELRLRQHLTLTPQLQQALRLLQLSALEFEQEMREALDTNPFLEEEEETPRPGASGSEPVAEAADTGTEARPPTRTPARRWMWMAAWGSTTSRAVRPRTTATISTGPSGPRRLSPSTIICAAS